MSITPTPVTAALAGTFSGLTWPLMWTFFNEPGASGTTWLLLATIGLVGVPAHALVLGFGRPPAGRLGSFDSALLGRIGTWLACAVLAALVVRR